MKSLGKFILPVPPNLHSRLKSDARAAGKSLNEHCTHILETGALRTRPDDSFTHDLVVRARSILRDRLAGVVIYGSWARGEATEASDIDVMIIADSRLTITRALITEWDKAPLTFDGHSVEAHFIAIPDSTSSISGMWAELAIDGIILFERQFDPFTE